MKAVKAVHVSCARSFNLNVSMFAQRLIHIACVAYDETHYRGNCMIYNPDR